MIVAQRKPFEEIKTMLKNYKKLSSYILMHSKSFDPWK